MKNLMIRNETHWGSWIFDVSRLVLYWGRGPYPYEIDLEDCTDSAQVLDWIAQLSHKQWCSAADIGDLVRALDDIFDLQAHFCPWGQNKTINASAFLRENW